jgi:Zn finger protein HypA/HybF involved in hydrogenase expression
MSYIGYTDQDIINAVKTSSSIRQVILKLNLIPAGGNYSTLHNKIKKLNLDTSHFTGQLWSKGKQIKLKVPIEDYLSNKQPIQSNKLKIRLLREGYFTYKCHNCNNTHWLNSPIPLELEHKDGNSSNNELSNLTLLCPNCHALTPTYRGKNKKS